MKQKELQDEKIEGETAAEEEKTPDTSKEPKDVANTAAHKGEEEDEKEDALREAKEEPEKMKKKKKKEKWEEKIEELEDRVKRQMAEFDNFRKRTEKEKSHMYEAGARDVLEKILPVVDNFERGLAAVTEEEKTNPVMEGMDKVYKQLMTILTDLGVTPIEAVGKEFEPNFHNAVIHVEDEKLGENVVAEEFQKGYLYKDAVIRHSMVKVAN